MTSFCDMARHLSAGLTRNRARFRGDTAPRARTASAEQALRADRGAQPSAREDSVSAPGNGAGERTRRGRVRTRREPLVEPRSVAARASAVSAPLPEVHGEVRAVLVSAGA